jgi:arylsulfatase
MAVSATAIACGLLLVGATPAQAAGDQLPYPETPFKGKIGPTRETSVTAWPEQPKAPPGAPNVVVILLDDLGFGAAGTFGGPAASPEIDKLAANGLRYNAINTDAICSPTRASLLSGRNHHQVGFGNLEDIAAGFPGYNALWHSDTASIAEMLKDNGYNTAAFGKWHNTPEWETSPAGPFNHWPTGLGFEYFYGFMGGDSSDWEPRLYRGTDPVEYPQAPGLHLTTALTDDAIHWIRQHEAVAPDKPFFVYFATAATHAPHHVPKEWIDKYKGQFDEGWDKISDETFARQKRMGIIPANADKTPRPASLPAWDSLTADQKKLYARQMEVYAGFLSHTDHEVGRLIQELRDEGIDKNTLVFYVVGDNGGSAEGSIDGSDRQTAHFAAGQEPVAEQLVHVDDLGSVAWDNHYAAAWAWATSTPFQWMKQIASHFGGTRNGVVISWPGHTNHPEIVRPQFGHVNDIAPTILAAAHIPFPDTVNGVKQIPFEGASLIPTFTNPKAPSQHREQYFELFGNRAIYQDGWVAAARRYEPWEVKDLYKKMYGEDFAHDKWELYHVDVDYSEAHDLADKYPDKLKALQAEFDKEARRNGVYPMTPLPFTDTPHMVPAAKTHFVYYDGVDRLNRDMVPTLGGRSYKMTAELAVPAGGASGVIAAEGGRYGGVSLYVQDGRVVYENNTFGVTHEKLVSSTSLPTGKAEVVTIFTVDPQATGANVFPSGDARPGTAQMFINGSKVGETHFSRFGGFRSSHYETFDIGRDGGSPVSAAYSAPNAFTGTIDKVSIDLTK